MKSLVGVVKVVLGILLLETFALYVVLTRTPEVKLKASDHISCDESGYADRHGSVDVQFQLGTYENRKLVVKTTVDSWKRADDICASWNNIGYELEK